VDIFDTSRVGGGTDMGGSEDEGGNRVLGMEIQPPIVILQELESA